MKVIIDHGETKRKIEGSFQICGSKEDLLSVAKQILATVEREENPFTYGWIEIYSDLPKTIANQQPKGWNE